MSPSSILHGDIGSDPTGRYPLRLLALLKLAASAPD
jgi:hypothetical protein